MRYPVTQEFLISHGFTPDFAIRFFCKVNKTDQCWFWTGCINKGGYGTISSCGKKKMYAHRASWIMHRGTIPDGFDVLHNCPEIHNRHCVNPDHLKLGRDIDNQRDRLTQRKSKPYIDLIRNTVDARCRMQEMADLYGVSLATVQTILDGAIKSI